MQMRERTQRLFAAGRENRRKISLKARDSKCRHLCMRAREKFLIGQYIR